MIHQLWRFVKKKDEHFFIKNFMRSEIAEFSQQPPPLAAHSNKAKKLAACIAISFFFCYNN
jgi:hypothetical protein